ncbi:hypothetical protein V1504DRAFT_464171, partial [Lipomyces starkeyi]
MDAIANRKSSRSAANRRQHITSHCHKTWMKTEVVFENFAPEKRTPTSQRHSLMDHLQLLRLVRRPLSPDTRLEVPASREEFDLVQEILDREDAGYPQLWYDGWRNVAIIVAPPTPLHSGIAGALLSRISDEVKLNSGISSEFSRNLTQDADRRTTKNTGRGLTTRAGDGALRYWEGKRATLMIAVEVGVSQQAISWSVVVLGCRLGLAMSIQEESRSRGAPPTRYYASLEEANAVLEEAEDDLYQQLLQHPYGPLEWDGETWSGKIGRVVLETYRPQDEDCPLDTLLEPSQSFVSDENIISSI